MTTIVHRKTRNTGRVARKPVVIKKEVPLRLIQNRLTSILGDAATTVVLKQIFPTYPQNRILVGRDLWALRRGLKRIFGDAGEMLYCQATGRSKSVKGFFK